MRRTSVVIAALGVVLLVSLGTNVYEYGIARRVSSLSESSWTDVKHGHVQSHVIINGTVFDDLQVPFGTGPMEYNLSNVTFTVRQCCPNNNGGFVIIDVLATYHGTGSQKGWNASLAVAPVFISGTKILYDFTTDTTPIVGVVLTVSSPFDIGYYNGDYFHFLVSSS